MFGIEKKEKGYQLLSAIVKGDKAAVEASLADGADVSFERDLPLLTAAFSGHFDILQLLVQKGADVHAGDDEALYYTLRAQDHQASSFLIEKGANIENMLKNHGQRLDRDTREALKTGSTQPLSEIFQQNHARMRQSLESKQRLKPKSGPKPRG